MSNPQIGLGPSVLVAFQPEQLAIDLLNTTGWDRTTVPIGKTWTVGNPDLPYEVEVRVRPRNEGQAPLTRLHQLVHALHQRLHGLPISPSQEFHGTRLL